MAGLRQDISFGIRMLTRNPGFTAVAVLTLALGIGANSTIFSVINAVFLKPLPFPEPDRLAMVWETRQDAPEDFDDTSMPNFRDWQRQNHVFESMALFDGKSLNLSDKTHPEQVHGLRVSSGYFSVLGFKPLFGRDFLPEEETLGNDKAAILTYDLWKRHYGGNPAIVGSAIQVGGEPYTVVGVMPASFRCQIWGSVRDIFVPVGYTQGDQARDSHSFHVIARLKAGVSLDQARAEMSAMGLRLSKEYPKENAKMTAVVTPMDYAGAKERWQVLGALLASVGFVLLIACVNVANLMLARNASRRREMAIRRTLGAGPYRLARQLLTESLLLALLGGAAGLVLAAAGTSALYHILPEYIRFVPFRYFEGISLDPGVLWFTAGLSCVTGILFGLAPAAGAFTRDVSNPLKEGSRGTTDAGGRLRNPLVAMEIAMALVVLSGAGLMLQSLSRLLAVNPGINPKNVLTMEVSLPQVNMYYGPPANTNYCREVASRVSSIPGVLAASSVNHLPLDGGAAGRGFLIEGRPDPGRENGASASYSVACPDYFKTMGIPVTEGREFTDADTEKAPGVIVINRTMARKYWPNEDPIGKRIRIGFDGDKDPWLAVVGVVDDFRQWGLGEKMEAYFFRPYTQAAWPYMNVVARTASAPMTYAAAVKKAVETNPEEPVANVRTMDEIASESLGPWRFPMFLLVGFSALAMLLAAVGIVGVVSYSVTQRTHEIGIRMALGAQPRDVLRLVVGKSMAWAAAGVATGVAGATGLTRLLTNLLYEVKPGDPVVLMAVSVLLGCVALLASYIPARRAMTVDPMAALRWE